MRRELAAIDPAVMKGLEIGPLANPCVSKSAGTIKYLDHASTEELRQKYRENVTLRPFVDDIVDVDYVADGTHPVSELVAEDAPFDYVVAAHVIEHIPDPIGWLLDLGEIIRPDGILSLVIPDKRFSFDVNRSVTEVSELVDGYLRGVRKPTIRQMYDFFSRVVTIDGSVDTAGIWAGTADYRGIWRSDVADPHVAAYQTCVEQVRLDHYVDVHCHLFTPSSFLDIYDVLARLDLMPYEIVQFFPTEVDQLEFFVSLRKLPVPVDQAARDEVRRHQQETVRHLRAAPSPSAEWDSGLPAGPDTLLRMVVSERERKMLALKRDTLTTLRQLVKRKGRLA